MKLHSTITNGQLSPEAQIAFAGALKQHEGQRVTVEVKKQVKRRSGNQNAFYYGVVLPRIVALFREYGDGICLEEVHRFLKGTVGGYKRPITTPYGETIWHVDTSTKLTTAEWENWMDLIRAWAAARGVQIPFPNEIEGIYL
jgi:hypothetical protein